MATWQAIEYAGQTLVALLTRHLARVLPGNNVDVQLASVAEFSVYAKATRPTITLFLYRIAENPELRNAAMRRLPDGSTSRQAMPVELCYMVTPWGVRAAETDTADQQAAAEEHRLLGVVLQAFYAAGEVARSDLYQAAATDTVWNQADNMQVLLEPSPVDEILRIWDSADQSYRTSLTYRARVVGVDPLDSQQVVRVNTARFQFGEP